MDIIQQSQQTDHSGHYSSRNHRQTSVIRFLICIIDVMSFHSVVDYITNNVAGSDADYHKKAGSIRQQVNDGWQAVNIYVLKIDGEKRMKMSKF